MPCVDTWRRVWRLMAGALLGVAVTCMAAAWAGQATPSAEDPALEARMLAIAAELRCLVCQNQTVADSHAALAVDLRNQVRDMLRQGADQQQVIDYMTARYGDFVLYRPPVRGQTWLLWFGPALLLLLSLLGLWLHLRRRQRQPPELFDADDSHPDIPA
jgi:cytochrome c-type biogenesis protein CcmH